MTIKQFANDQHLKLDLTKVPFRTDSVGKEWDTTAKHFLYRKVVNYIDEFRSTKTW